jgi:signal transduction histidine kinase
MRHGGAVLRRGHPIDSVVREYVDLGRAVDQIARETGARAHPPRSCSRSNRCLGQASQEAVAEFEPQRQAILAQSEHREATERLGFLAHELRNFLNTAVLSFAAIRSGGVGRRRRDRRRARPQPLRPARPDQHLARGSAGRRALRRGATGEHRGGNADRRHPARREPGRGHPLVRVRGGARGAWPHAARRSKLLNSALSNLVQNAFKFTASRTHVSLRARASGERVLIEVEDRCGGLPAGKAGELFALFAQHHPNRSGLGLGLSISRSAVEKCGGTVGVRDLPGLGCVFTIDLPAPSPRARPAPRHPPSCRAEPATRRRSVGKRCCTNSWMPTAPS